MPLPTIIERTPETPIQAEGGKTTRLAIRAPAAGEVKRVYLKQVTITKTDGVVTGVADATDGFTYQWFTAAAGCPPGVDTEVSQDLQDRYAAGPAVTVEAGDSLVMKDDKPDDFGQSFEYANRDGGLSTRSGQVYLQIAPNGTGMKTFVLYLQIKPASS